MQSTQNSWVQGCPEADSCHSFDVGSARARGREVLSHTYEVTYTGVIGPEARLYLYEQVFLAAKGRMTLEIGHHAIWWGDPNDHSYGGAKQTLERLAFGSVGVWLSPIEKYEKSLIRAHNLRQYGIVRVVFPLEDLPAALAFCESQRPR
jgi:hypothetical protein